MLAQFSVWRKVRLFPLKRALIVVVGRSRALLRDRSYFLIDQSSSYDQIGPLIIRDIYRFSPRALLIDHEATKLLSRLENSRRDF